MQQAINGDYDVTVVVSDHPCHSPDNLLLKTYNELIVEDLCCDRESTTEGWCFPKMYTKAGGVYTNADGTGM